MIDPIHILVTPSVKDPFPGWIDNFNDPMGLYIAAGKGLLRVLYHDKSVRLDCVPVDYFVKYTLRLAWYIGSNKYVKQIVIKTHTYTLKIRCFFL